MICQFWPKSLPHTSGLWWLNILPGRAHCLSLWAYRKWKLKFHEKKLIVCGSFLIVWFLANSCVYVSRLLPCSSIYYIWYFFWTNFITKKVTCFYLVANIQGASRITPKTKAIQTIQSWAWKDQGICAIFTFQRYLPWFWTDSYSDTVGQYCYRVWRHKNSSW